MCDSTGFGLCFPLVFRCAPSVLFTKSLCAYFLAGSFREGGGHGGVRLTFGPAPRGLTPCFLSIWLSAGPRPMCVKLECGRRLCINRVRARVSRASGWFHWFFIGSPLCFLAFVCHGFVSFSISSKLLFNWIPLGFHCSLLFHVVSRW